MLLLSKATLKAIALMGLPMATLWPAMAATHNAPAKPSFYITNHVASTPNAESDASAGQQPAPKGGAVITGSIKDSTTSEPLIGATVVIKGTFRGTTTDDNGYFSLKIGAASAVNNVITSGGITLEVSAIGYSKKTIIADANSTTPLNIILGHSQLITEEVLVNATRGTEKTATTYATVTAADIKKQNLGQDMPFLLNLTPSAVATSDAGTGIGYSGLRIRGSDATRINVTINGVPINDAESQQMYWVNMPDLASSVSSIQVQRGVGTSTNGQGAFGGSINILTNTASRDPYANYATSVGSFRTWKNTASFGTGIMQNGWAVDGRLSRTQSAGYVERGAADLKSFYASATHYGTKSLLKLIVFSGVEKTYQSWLGVPEDSLKTNRRYNAYNYPNQTDNYQQDYYQLHYNYQITPKLSAGGALHYTRGSGYYEEYAAGQSLASYGIDSARIGAAAIGTSDLVRQKWLANDFYGVVYNVTYKNNASTFILGGGVNQYKGAHFGKVIWAQYAGNSTIGQRYYDNDATKSDGNIYGRLTHNLSTKLTGFIDLQLRMVQYNFNGINANLESVQQDAPMHRFFNPKAGLTYQISATDYGYISYAVGNKEPNRDDYTQSTAAQRPKPESLQNVEIGFKHQPKSHLLAANFYYMHYQNQLVQTGKLNDVGNAVRINIPESYRAGIELEAGTRPYKWLNLGANLTLSANKILNWTEYIDSSDAAYTNTTKVTRNYSSANLAFSPSVIAMGIVSISPIANRLIFDVITKHVGQQYLDNTQSSNRALAAYTVLDFRANYTFTSPLFKEVRLSLLINNVLNAQYSSNGYTYGDITAGVRNSYNSYYPQAGTNILAGISVGF